MSEDRAPISPEKARDQAAEFLSVFDGQDFDLGGESWHLPNPNYMPRDMKKRHLEHLRFINKDLDTRSVPDPVTGKEVKRTEWPLQYKGQVIDEDELLCIALMGTDAVKDREAYFKDGTLPDVYARFLEAGGIAGQVQVQWSVMNLQMQERVKRDPFRS